MSLSLEIKKFVNNEHTGSYVTIMLPVELPPEPAPASARKPKAAQRKQAAETAASLASVLEATAQENADYDTLDFDDVPALGIDEEEMPKAASAKEATPQWQSDPGFTPPPRIQYEATRIHYTDEGEGEPLILIHSVGQSSYTWRKVFYRLREYYRVIVVDLPGHGYSDRPVHFDYTVEAHAMALRLFMDALKIESAHLTGFSLGAVYALQFACDYPSRVGRLVLLSPGGVTEDMPMPVKLIDSALLGGLASRLYGMGTVRKLLEECVFDLTNINDEVIQEYYKPASDPEGRRCIRASLHSFDEQPILPRLREVQCPVLILHGSEDKWHKAQEVDLFHAAIRGAGFSVIRNVGHLLHEEKPDRLIAAILEFIPVIMPGG